MANNAQVSLHALCKGMACVYNFFCRFNSFASAALAAALASYSTYTSTFLLILRLTRVESFVHAFSRGNIGTFRST